MKTSSTLEEKNASPISRAKSNFEKKVQFEPPSEESSSPKKAATTLKFSRSTLDEIKEEDKTPRGQDIPSLRPIISEAEVQELVLLREFYKKMNTNSGK